MPKKTQYTKSKMEDTGEESSQTINQHPAKQTKSKVSVEIRAFEGKMIVSYETENNSR